MEKNIIIDRNNGLTRAALVEDGELAEIYIEEENLNAIAGNIYKGIVMSVLPGMDAAFINIGLDKNAFLYVGDAVIKDDYSENETEEIRNKISINDVVKVGQEILVQVIKEGFGTKGPRVSANITLPGRYIVLVPNAGYIGISTKIENPDERERLKQEIQRLKHEGFGIIARTAAEGCSYDDFEKDFQNVLKQWNNISKKAENCHGARLIYKDLKLAQRLVRDIFTEDICKLVTNDKEVYDEVIEMSDMLSANMKSKIELFSKDYAIFEYYNIEASLEKALSKKVWLKSGGYIIIEPTEALTVIDVNSGKFVGSKNLEQTILKINIEAAKVIAKQIRLRDIGGIIVIDFIDMMEQRHKDELLETLVEELKKDRTKTHVIGISAIGLVEMTRKKKRQSLSSNLQVQCPVCKGDGRILSTNTIVRKIMRDVEKLFSGTVARGAIVEAHGTVIKQLEESIGDLKRKFGKVIMIKQGNINNPEEFKVKDVDNV